MEKTEETFLPSEAWREKYEEQATKKMLERLNRAARTRLRLFAGRTGHVSSADVDDTVMSVIDDTLRGRLKWAPEKEPLEEHLRDAIRSRVRDRWKRDQRHKHDMIDEDGSDQSVADRAEAGAIVPASPISSAVASDRENKIKLVYDEVVATLRPRCVGKPEVLQLFDLYVRGITERDEVLEASGMSETNYHNARRRLGRLVQDLPASLRDAALNALN